MNKDYSLRDLDFAVRMMILNDILPDDNLETIDRTLNWVEALVVRLKVAKALLNDK